MSPISALHRAANEARLRKAGLAAPLADALATERKSRAAIEGIQSEKLRRLIAHAAATVPFWRARFPAQGFDPFKVRSIADLSRLPLLEKEDLRARSDALLMAGRPDPEWIKNASGGSTGTPVVFYQDREYHRRMLADQLRHITWTGVPWWAARAFVWGSDRDSHDHDGATGRLKDVLAGVHYLNSFKARDEDYRDFAQECRRARVPILIGYASSLDHFARVVEASGAPSAWRPSAIQSSAERLTPEMRERIERVFGARVFDRYGSREMGNAAHECEAHAGLHVSMERIALEIVRAGRPVPDGEEGEIVVTVLDNLAEPLIRYRVGDVGRKVTGPPCTCGRAYERIEITAGRTSDVFTSPSGRRIHGEYFTHLFYGKAGVALFRVTQETRERILIEIVRAPSFAEGELESVQDGIREIDPGFLIEVRYVDDLPIAESGKRRFTVSNVPVEWAP